MAPHHTLALKAMKAGGDKIPDKAFEKIPLAGPRLFKEKDRGKSGGKGKERNNDNNNTNDDDQQQYWSSDSEPEQREAPRRRRRQRRERERRDRGYESDRGTPSNMTYFPPPPTVPIYQQPNQGTETPPYQPYNPADYINRQQQGTPSSTYGSDGSPHRSSIADRYRPAGYPAPDESYQRGPSPQKQLGYPTYEPPQSTALAVRPSDEVYPHYPPQQAIPPPIAYEDYDRHHRDRDRDRRGSSKLREELKEHKDVGVSALGALAGGILGSGMSRGNGKMGMLVGAALGGIGANVVEKKFEKNKQEKERSRSRKLRKEDYEYGYDSY